MSAKSGTVPKTVDEIVDGSNETVDVAMRVAEREWGRIALSLEMCGRAGDFDPSVFMIGVIAEDVIIKKPFLCATKSVDTNSPTYYPMYLVKNLLEMDALMPENGYRTRPALYCHIELATKAVASLGLSGTLAMGFACGYAVARTGWIAEKGLRREREFFLKTFFENSPRNYEWGFGWHSTRTRLKKIFDRFALWQKDGEAHKRETAEERPVKPLLV